jgi:hypothetical protein
MATDPTKTLPSHEEMAEMNPDSPQKGTDEVEDGFMPVDEHFHKVAKRMVRKLDMTLMPIIWLLYLFNYLDRTAIAYVIRVI